MNYNCRLGFTSLKTNKWYSAGTTISQYEYNQLPLNEQYNFNKKEDEPTSYGSQSNNDYDVFGSFSSMLSNDSITSSSNDSSSSFDFGGGGSGFDGGGSSGDF